MRLPQIQIEQTPARLDITSQQGRFDIRQSSAKMDINTTSGSYDIKTEQPVVIVDMTKTWDALNGGNHLSYMNRIYNQFGQFVNRAIENTVSEYDQIGDLTNDQDPIPTLAWQSIRMDPPKLQHFGEASRLNVSFEAQLTKPEITFNPGRVDINVTPNKPKVDFHRGGVNIQMAQYPSVQITAPQIDLMR